MATPLRVGIIGLGTVGSGTAKILEQNAELIAQRTGRPIRVTAVCARDRHRDRGITIDAYRWHDDALDLVRDEQVDLVCELVGGSHGLALDACRTALELGKPVVTANKAMLAENGAELADIADRTHTPLAYEAAVAGGIPIVKSLREGLVANKISRVYGILNGTCNYILTSMQETGRGFDEVLTEAQALGYAEADPAFDVDGIDAAHKLALLASIAFGGKPRFSDISIEGIRHVTALDISFASELGYRIKLLGIARMGDEGLEQRLHPCMVSKTAPIAQVDGVFNAVAVEGDEVDVVLFEGRGAGAGPTASAVVADIADIARGIHVPVFGVQANSLSSPSIMPTLAHIGRYYIRLMVVDRPGVLADIAAVLRDHEVSIEALIQRARNPNQPVPIVLTSHQTSEGSMLGALAAIGGLDSVLEEPRMIRIENF